MTGFMMAGVEASAGLMTTDCTTVQDDRLGAPAAIDSTIQGDGTLVASGEIGFMMDEAA